MIITIGGRAGSGKSTVAKILAKKLGFRHHSMGDMIRRIAEEKEMSLLELNRLQERDATIDHQIDEMQKNIGKRENNFVLDSRLGALFIPNADFKVFLDADEDVRAQRIMKDARNIERSSTLNDTLAKIKEREESEIKRYRQYYDFDCYDKNKYDIVINTTKLTPDEVVEQIIRRVKDESKQE